MSDDIPFDSKEVKSDFLIVSAFPTMTVKKVLAARGATRVDPQPRLPGILPPASA